MAYTVSVISPNDIYANRCMDALLKAEGIKRDRNLDYSCGIFDDGELIATASCYENTLRCFAVDSMHRGENFINILAGHLIEVQLQRGNSHFFVYTKRQSSVFFKSLGFYPIAETDSVSFLENRRDGFARFCRSLESAEKIGTKAAVVMNANPFTLGHQALVEHAAAENDLVYVFVLSEDKSYFSFRHRIELVRHGLAHLPNVLVYETGSYMISSATFPGYFLEDDREVMSAHAQLDAEIFCSLAKQTGISRRYLGQEESGSTVELYNSILSSTLPSNGIECHVIPRRCHNGIPISAKRVRDAIQRGAMSELDDLVPKTTLRHLYAVAEKIETLGLREQ